MQRNGSESSFPPKADGGTSKGPSARDDWLADLSADPTVVYNEMNDSYSRRKAYLVPTTHVMKISSNGQVSIPAEARARWNTERVVVVDLGDRVVLRPLPEEPISSLIGKYRGRGPDSDRARRASRIDDSSKERRH